MKIDVSPLFNDVQSSIPIRALLSYPDEQRCGRAMLPAPVAVQGELRNHCGVVELSYEASFTLHTACDRCLQELASLYRQRFFHTLVMAEQESADNDFVAAPEGQLDLSALVRSDILLELPGVVLCRQDCKGLCPHCGADLNQQECQCVQQEHFGPWGALRALLEETEG